MLKKVLRALGAVAAIVALAVAAYAVYVYAGLRASAKLDGNIQGLNVRQPVNILRDARGVPHIRAQNEHDLFFAEGYVEGQDRLFQLDLMRRYALGTLSEVFGKPALDVDESQRTVPVAQIVDFQYRRLPSGERAILEAFADGVNAAMRREPKPVELRILLYNARPWRPQDSLAVAFGMHLTLVDSWKDVASEVGRDLPLTDPCFDAPVVPGLRKIADFHRCIHNRGDSILIRELRHPMLRAGSNAWAAGALHTSTGRALLANDPHLGLTIPGIWYLVDLKSPGYHAAGATLPGTPGVILGHNDRLAWGVTNADTTALSIYDAPAKLDPRGWQTESFHLRLRSTVKRRYYRTRQLFGAVVRLPDGHKRFVLVRWGAYADPTSPLQTFEHLDRAQSAKAALAVLRSFPGPSLDFIVADTSGRVAYHLTGKIPDDPLWGGAFHRASDISRAYAALPFSVLPKVAPSRDAIVWSASNKMYGSGYPYRLSARFTPPYRAYRIAQLLRAVSRYSPEYFANMQMDVLSLPERELAHSRGRLQNWNGAFVPASRDATVANGMREELVAHRNTSSTGKPAFDPKPWRLAGAVPVQHPLSAVGFLGFLNGVTFPGDGDSYTLHLQREKFSQSFRAVWDVGNWDAGGISLPQGESGEPGSGHYTDEAASWIRGELLSLPYSDAAVRRATVARLTLSP